MLIIDRFEDNFAVCTSCEDDSTVKIDRNAIVSTAREGDIIYSEDNIYIVDEAATLSRRSAMANKMNSIFNRNKGGIV